MQWNQQNIRTRATCLQLVNVHKWILSLVNKAVEEKTWRKNWWLSMLNSENDVWHRSYARMNIESSDHVRNIFSRYHLAKLITRIEETKLMENIVVDQKQDVTTCWLGSADESSDDDAIVNNESRAWSDESTSLLGYSDDSSVDISSISSFWSPFVELE